VENNKRMGSMRRWKGIEIKREMFLVHVLSGE
jgi:hypothetical protein